MTRFRRVCAVSLLAAAGCTGGLSDSDVPAPSPITHAFPGIELGAFEERTGDCQSWTLGNDEPLFVHAVEMQSDAGWHHSNWLYVPEDRYDGPDGTWDCDERDYVEVEAGLSGGVLYAQSTQVTAERQAFPAGSAVRIPERSRIIAQVHVINATDAPISSAITLTLEPMYEESVVHKLRPFVTSYFPLEIPPQEESQFSSHCDAFDANNDAPLDFSMFYVLPHYHQWGTGFYLKAWTGTSNEIVVFDQSNQIGEPLGLTLDPPVDLTGVTHMEFGCRYENLGDVPVYWENDDSGEMCMMLAYSNDSAKWVGGALDVPNVVVGTNGEGVILNEAECRMVRI